MPELESWNIEVSVTVRVNDFVHKALVLESTTTGRSRGNSSGGLSAGVQPALAAALTDLGFITDNFRKEARRA